MLGGYFYDRDQIAIDVGAESFSTLAAHVCTRSPKATTGVLGNMALLYAFRRQSKHHYLREEEAKRVSLSYCAQS